MFNLKNANKKSDVREVSVEDATVMLARSMGFSCFKVNFLNYKGAADRMFVKNGLVFFIEFKKPKGGVVATLQRKFSRLMKAQKVKSYFAYTKAEGAEVLRAMDELQKNSIVT